MSRFLFVVLLVVGCDEAAKPAQEAGAVTETPEWTEYQKVSADLRTAKADVEKRVDGARSRLIECHKSLVSKAQAALPPDPKALASAASKMPADGVVANAPVNPEGVRFLPGPGEGAGPPCGTSDDKVKDIQDRLRATMNTVPFTPKGARECHPDSAPYDDATRKSCKEGIAFLAGVLGKVKGLAAEVDKVVPPEIAPLTTVVATDRMFCEEAKAGVQFTTRTIFAVTCSRTRFWVDVKAGTVVGSLTRVHKQPSVRPKDPDPSIAALAKAQETTRMRAEEGVLKRVDRASGYPSKR